MLTIKEAAQAIGVVEKTIRRRIAEGSLLAYRTARALSGWTAAHCSSWPVRWAVQREWRQSLKRWSSSRCAMPLKRSLGICPSS